MIKKKNYQTNIKTYDAPESLEDNLFYGLELDEEQKDFRDKIYNPDTKIIMCNSKAGTGKTTISIGVANLMVQYGLYDGIIYIVSPTNEQRQGYLPGDQEEKSAPYMDPLLDALITIGLDPTKVLLSNENIEAMKNGTAYIKFMVDTYIRGCNFENKIVIVDEAQNFYGSNLKKTLTRIHDNCKVIIIGHSEQCDLYKHPENSGFNQYLNAFKNMEDPRLAICNLTTNHRGWISTVCDNVEIRG